MADPAGRLARFRRRYRQLATVLLNTAILLAALNGLALAWRLIPRDLPEIAHYGLDRIARAYPGFPASEIPRLLYETYHDDRRNFAYEQVTQFKEPAYQGRYVNVDGHGFRIGHDQGPWPPDPAAFNVFVFGGSTTFGYGLPDPQAIPSVMQELAGAERCQRPVHVYNFGRASYFSTQEELLFQSLLTAHVVPDAAVFVDGLNDFYLAEDELSFTRELSLLMAERTPRQWVGKLIDLPVVYWASHAIADRFGPATPTPDLRDEATLLHLIDRWQQNRTLSKLLADKFGVKTLFVIQPVPMYGYDLAYHLFYEDDPDFWGDFGRATYGYQRMSRERADLERNGDLLWLADVQRDRKENLYVDFVHYDAAFSRELAATILRALEQRRIVPCRDAA